MATPVKAHEIKEIFTLPSGKEAQRIALPGRYYFEFRRKIQQDQEVAMKEVMIRSYLIEGQPLTIDLLEDQLSFEDNICLGTKIDQLFLAAQPKSTP